MSAVPAFTLIKYVRNNKGVPRGVIVAVKTEDNYKIGWALCRKTDRFSKTLGRDIAIGRALTKGEDHKLPHSLSKHYGSFTERADKYYKISR